MKFIHTECREGYAHSPVHRTTVNTRLHLCLETWRKKKTLRGACKLVVVTQLVATITQTKFNGCITSFLSTNQWKLPTWWPTCKTLLMTADYTYQPYYGNGMPNQAMQQCFQFVQEKFALKRWKGGIKKQYVLFFIFSSSQNLKPKEKEL